MIAWDWSLEIWAPRVAQILVAEEFHLRIQGVNRFNSATGHNFQFAISKTSDITGAMSEYKKVTETPSPVTAFNTYAECLQVTEFGFSSYLLRDKTKLTAVVVIADNPDTTLTTAGTFLTVELPASWGPVFNGGGGFAKFDVSRITIVDEVEQPEPLEKVATYAFGTTIVFESTTAWVAGATYKLEITDLLTPLEPMDKLNSFVIKIGDGVNTFLAYTDDSQWDFTTPDFAHHVDLDVLKYETRDAELKRGTYSAEICIIPSEDGARFSKDVKFTIDNKGSGITTTPSVLVGMQGSNKACGRIGAPATTQPAFYGITFNKDEGTGTSYTKLGLFWVEVTDKKGDISISTAISCIPGCQATPILVSVGGFAIMDATNIDFPYAAEGVEVVIEAITADEAGATASKGVTLVTDSIVLTLNNPTGVLAVSCDAKPTDTAIDLDTIYGSSGSVAVNYKFGGTDVENFWKLSSGGSIAITVEKERDNAPIEGGAAVLTDGVADSDASKHQVTVACPESEVGVAYGVWQPAGGVFPTATGAELKKLADAYDAEVAALEFGEKTHF